MDCKRLLKALKINIGGGYKGDFVTGNYIEQNIETTFISMWLLYHYMHQPAEQSWNSPAAIKLAL